VAFARYVDGTSSSGSSTAAVDLSACSVGDLAFVFISRSGTTAPSGVPDGWNLLQSHDTTYGIWLYEKVLEAGDIATLTWTWAASVRTLAHANVYTSATYASSTKGTFADGATADCGSIVSSSPWLAMFCFAGAPSNKSWDALAGYTERRDHGDTSSDHWHLLADTNGAWGGGACAPDFTLSAAGASAGGFIVEFGSPAPPSGYMTLNRGIW
jgi:hypothetical protein